MFTFNSPCLRWKLVLALKGQYGWPGYLAPFQTRYLSKLVVVTLTAAFGGPSRVSRQTTLCDRISGAFHTPEGFTANPGGEFPYGDPLTNTTNDIQHSTGEIWEGVTDNYFKHTTNNGVFIIQTEVTLSNPYTLTMLDADADALIASISVLNMPWKTLMIARYGELSLPDGPYTPNGDLTLLLPPQVTYPGIQSPGPNNIPQLNAAAWSIFAPGDVGQANWFPNGYSKLVGYIAMAGNYCLKTFTIDYAQTLLNQTCQSGQGSCATPFKVTPPSPPTPGQNSYVLLQPNCQCG